MAFTIIVGALCALMVIGMPIAFAFLAVNIAGAWLFMGGLVGINAMVLAVMDSVASFSIMPVPLFLLMGELLFRSGIAARLLSERPYLTPQELESIITSTPSRIVNPDASRADGKVAFVQDAPAVLTAVQIAP